MNASNTKPFGIHTYTVVIGGKEYSIAPKLWHMRYALKKYDLSSILEWTRERYDSYIIDLLWLMLESNAFCIKPFLFKRRLSKAISVKEIKRLRIDIQRVILGREPMTQEEFLEAMADQDRIEDEKADSAISGKQEEAPPKKK